jgi:hypothetical protein
MFYSRSLRTSSKRSRAKDEVSGCSVGKPHTLDLWHKLFIANFLKDTYVLTIDIVKGLGSDSQQTTDVVPALALFNASSEHSWISKRFAEKLGIITQDRGTEGGGFTESVKLAWKCPALGRYVQRTVFMIALLADFDVLFAEQRDENSRPSERDQFQRSIQKGLLKRVVQKGIADGTMLRVVHNPSGGSADPATPVMPTIAQLEAQLLHDTEGHRNYHRKHSCNIRSVHAIHGPDCCQLLDPQRRQSTSTTANEGIIEGYIDGQGSSEPSLCQDEGATYPVKRTKLNQDISTGDECQSFITDSGARETCPSSPSSPTSYSQALEPPEIPTYPESVSARSAADASGSLLMLDKDSTRRELGSKSSIHRRNLRPRKPVATNSVSRGGSIPKVSTMSEAITTLTQKTSPDGTCTPSPLPCRAKSEPGSDTDTTNSDPLDPDYWTWDEAEQNYYHIDKASSEKLWYEAPP